MRPWQFLALGSGVIITPVMALASISYNATLGTGDPAFPWLPLTNRMLFASMALAFDLGMIASVFGFLHWWISNRMAAIVCLILFAIASVYSVHSVRGYIAQNVTRSLAPHERNKDIYASLKLELKQTQTHLTGLRAALLKARGRKRKRLAKEVKQQVQSVQEARSHLAQTDSGQHVSPLQGLEWFLSVSLWFFHSTCWSAWFGSRSASQSEVAAPSMTSDTVRSWLGLCTPVEPMHCAALYHLYKNWCDEAGRDPLPRYGFYARLIELGAHKFRNGRNGPTMYALPHIPRSK